jgi:hypothetical protein
MSLVTISAGNIAEYHGTGTPAFARLFANQEFITSEGKTIAAGSPSRNPDFYQEFECSQVGDDIQIASGEAYTTTDSSVTSATYTLCIYDDEDRLLLTPYYNIRIPETTDPTTWKILVNYSSARIYPNPPSHMDTETFLRTLQEYSDTALKGSDVVRGVWRSRTAPADATDPVLLADSDPRVIKLNAGLYDDFAAAVTAASILPGTKILSVTEQLTVEDDVAVPADVTLQFDANGLLDPLAGGPFDPAPTVTILGRIEAGPHRIFGPLADLEGAGTIDISAATADKFYFEWKGITSAGNNATSMQWLIDQRVGKPTLIQLLYGTVYSFGSPLSFDDTRGMVLQGVGGYASSPELRYTGSGSTAAITCKSSQGFTLIAVSVSYTSATFTGDLLETGHTATIPISDTAGLVIDRCQFSGAGGTAINAASLITLEQSIDVSITNCYFANALSGVQGFRSSYANIVKLDTCIFTNCGIGVLQTGESWNLYACGFEPTTSAMPSIGVLAGQTRAIGNNGQTSYNLVMSGGWIGDGIATTGSYAAIDLFVALGVSITGVKISMPGSLSGHTSAIQLNSCEGVSISGNQIVGPNRFMTRTGGFTRGLSITGNNIAAGTTGDPVDVSGGGAVIDFYLGNDGIANQINDGLIVADGLTIGTSGTALTTVLKGTVAIDPSNIAAGIVSEQSFTLTGAVVGDALELNPPSAGLTTGLTVLQYYVSAANTVKITFWNSTGGAINQASGNWTYKLTRS